MKAVHYPVVLPALMLVVIFSAALQAEDWTTTDGKVYQNVTVLKAEPDAVTILYKEGGALVPLAKLPADVQKRFNYDPAQAKIAADARAKTEQVSANALLVEKVQAAKLAVAKAAKDKADQKAAAARIAAFTNTPPDPGISIANPKDFENGDILGKPKSGAGTSTPSDPGGNLTNPNGYANRDILSKPNP